MFNKLPNIPTRLKQPFPSREAMVAAIRAVALREKERWKLDAALREAARNFRRVDPDGSRAMAALRSLDE